MIVTISSWTIVTISSKVVWKFAFESSSWFEISETLLANLERKVAFWLSLPSRFKKKWRSTFITRSCTMPTLCMRGIAILALPNTVKNVIYALLVQFHSKIKETKRTSIKVLKFVLIMFWFVQLVHFSVHYAVFVITPPYARYHVMLLWGRNNGNKASENVWQYF